MAELDPIYVLHQMNTAGAVPVRRAVRFMFLHLDAMPGSVSTDEVAAVCDLPRTWIRAGRVSLLNLGCIEEGTKVMRVKTTVATDKLVAVVTSFNSLYTQMLADETSETEKNLTIEALGLVARKYTPGVRYSSRDHLLAATAKIAGAHPQSMLQRGLRAVAALAWKHDVLDAIIGFRVKELNKKSKI